MDQAQMTERQQFPAVEPHPSIPNGGRLGIVLFPGKPTLLPGTDVEVRWDFEDNVSLLERSLPDRPGLAMIFRSLPPEELAQRRPAVEDETPSTPTTRPLDGAALRRARERLGVPLRRVAARSEFSHGYLSKVELGEPGRPVTPEVVAAYRKAGVSCPVWR